MSSRNSERVVIAAFVIALALVATVGYGLMSDSDKTQESQYQVSAETLRELDEEAHAINYQLGCMPLEPSPVQLTGKVFLKTFPGRPNFESIENGDEAETALYLVMDKPVCVEQGPENIQNNWHNDELDHVTMFQLGVDIKQYNALKKHQGEDITVSGIAWIGVTAHYHAPVFVDIAKFTLGYPADYLKWLNNR